MRDKIAAALDLFRCHILFVHRDSDGQNPEWRYNEVRDAIGPLANRSAPLSYVCVVPIRMTEAWLLVDEVAIRNAAGNPAGEVSLTLPRLQQIEDIPNPKALLRNLLRTASEMSGRRLKRFHDSQCARRVADYMRDFDRLRALSGFRRLEADLRHQADLIIARLDRDHGASAT